MKASEHDQLQANELTPKVLVRSAHYWGKGNTVAEAIKNAQWIQGGDEVLVVAVDEEAYCDVIEGALHYDTRGPIFEGVVMANCRDIRNVKKFRD